MKSVHDIFFFYGTNGNKKQSDEFYLLIELKRVHPFSIVLLRQNKKKQTNKHQKQFRVEYFGVTQSHFEYSQ